MAKQAVASYRRRGAHAAARKPVTPFVSVKRDPQPAVGGHAPRSGGAGGLVSGLRSRSRQLKLGAAGLVCALLVAGIATGIVSGEPSAEPAAQNFLLAWAQGQYKAAAALTTGPPGPVTTALRTAYQQLGAAAYYLSMGRISQHSGGSPRPISTPRWTSARMARPGITRVISRCASCPDPGRWCGARPSSTRGCARVNGWPW